MISHNSLISKEEQAVQELQAHVNKKLENYEEKFNHYFSNYPEAIVNGYMVIDDRVRKLTLMELSDVATLPDSLGDFEALEELRLTGNQLHSIPKSIGNL